MVQKVLLVDDRPDNLLSLETLLAPMGYELVKAASGRDALKVLLNDLDFALILMDVQMPHLNGFETASLIYERQKLRHIPIIFITAIDFGEEQVFKGYRAGAVDYLYKPINPDLLRTKVGVFVELYKKNQQLVAQEQRLIAVNRSLELEIGERMHSENRVIELNRQLMQTVSRLEAANKELDSFAFMASHDLQEPLRKIRTFGELLLEHSSEILEESGRKYLRSIQSAASRMQALIEDLLSFSKVVNDHSPAETCDLNHVFNELKLDLEAKIKAKNAVIDVEDLPAVPGNAHLLRSLFYNLLENALKYSRKQGAPHISVKAEEVELPVEPDGHQAYCRITVSDNGIGFEQQYAEHIFSIFRRLHNHTEFEGTGIGLAICKKIVEKHQGMISVRSETDQGSSFVVTLPIVREEKVAVPQTA